MVFFQLTASLGVRGGGGGGDEGRHHNFVVIAPMITKFSKGMKLDVFFTMVTNKL